MAYLAGETGSMWMRLRALLGAGILLMAGLVSIGRAHRNWDQLSSPAEAPAKMMAEILSKEQCLQSALPTQGRIGFVIDKNGSIDLGTTGENPDLLRMYYLTQYMLTPRLVEPNLDHPYLVSAPRGQDSPAEIAQSLNLAIEIDCGSGAVVFTQILK